MSNFLGHGGVAVEAGRMASPRRSEWTDHPAEVWRTTEPSRRPRRNRTPCSGRWPLWPACWAGGSGSMDHIRQTLLDTNFSVWVYILYILYMTSILDHQPLKIRSFPIKTEVKSVLGIYIYIILYTHRNTYIIYLPGSSCLGVLAFDYPTLLTYNRSPTPGHPGPGSATGSCRYLYVSWSRLLDSKIY